MAVNGLLAAEFRQNCIRTRAFAGDTRCPRSPLLRGRSGPRAAGSRGAVATASFHGRPAGAVCWPAVRISTWAGRLSARAGRQAPCHRRSIRAGRETVLLLRGRVLCARACWRSCAAACGVCWRCSVPVAGRPSARHAAVGTTSRPVGGGNPAIFKPDSRRGGGGAVRFTLDGEGEPPEARL